MATQQSLNSSINMLDKVVKASTCAADVTSYWTGLLAKRYTLHANGTVQSTMSNPLAYFCVPLSGDGTRGRSHDFTLAQFEYALTQGWTKNAHIALRGVNENAIKAGMAFARPRQDSTLGSVEGRLAATMVSAQANPKARQQGAKLVSSLESAKQSKDRTAFENTSLTIAALIEKYAKAPKPVAVKKGKGKFEDMDARDPAFDALPESAKIAIVAESSRKCQEENRKIQQEELARKPKAA